MIAVVLTPIVQKTTVMQFIKMVMVGSTTDNFHTFLGLINGAEYELELRHLESVLQKYLP